MKKTIEIVEKLQAYFGLNIIGSYLLIKVGLDYDLVNDIDLLYFGKDNKILPIRLFLRDNGFIETKGWREPKGYAFEQGSLYFENKEYDKPIHICITNNLEGSKILPNSEIIATKFRRRTQSDVKQLKNIINKL